MTKNEVNDLFKNKVDGWESPTFDENGKFNGFKQLMKDGTHRYYTLKEQ